MDVSKKEVNFALYCKTCTNKDLEGFKSPCNECLEVPVREGTSKPEKYEAIKDRKKTIKERRTQNGGRTESR